MSYAHARALSDHPASGFFARVTEVERGPSAAIEIAERVRLGGRMIDPGLYRVRVDDTRERVVLENDDRTYALTAFFRRARGPASFAMNAWIEWTEGRPSLVVRLARGLEWVA